MGSLINFLSLGKKKRLEAEVEAFKDEYITSVGILRFDQNDWQKFKAVCHDQRTVWNALVEEHYRRVLTSVTTDTPYVHIGMEDALSIVQKAGNRGEKFTTGAKDLQLTVINDFFNSIKILENAGRLLEDNTLTFRASTGMQTLNIPLESDGDGFTDQHLDFGNFIKNVPVSWATPLPKEIVTAYAYSHVGIPPSVTVIGKVH